MPVSRAQVLGEGLTEGTRKRPPRSRMTPADVAGVGSRIANDPLFPGYFAPEEIGFLKNLSTLPGTPGLQLGQPNLLEQLGTGTIRPPMTADPNQLYHGFGQQLMKRMEPVSRFLQEELGAAGHPEDIGAKRSEQAAAKFTKKQRTALQAAVERLKAMPSGPLRIAEHADLNQKYGPTRVHEAMTGMKGAAPAPAAAVPSDAMIAHARQAAAMPEEWKSTEEFIRRGHALFPGQEATYNAALQQARADRGAARAAATNKLAAERQAQAQGAANVQEPVGEITPPPAQTPTAEHWDRDLAKGVKQLRMRSVGVGSAAWEAGRRELIGVHGQSAVEAEMARQDAAAKAISDRMKAGKAAAAARRAGTTPTTGASPAPPVGTPVPPAGPPPVPTNVPAQANPLAAEAAAVAPTATPADVAHEPLMGSGAPQVPYGSPVVPPQKTLPSLRPGGGYGSPGTTAIPKATTPGTYSPQTPYGDYPTTRPSAPPLQPPTPPVTPKAPRVRAQRPTSPVVTNALNVAKAARAVTNPTQPYGSPAVQPTARLTPSAASGPGATAYGSPTVGPRANSGPTSSPGLIKPAYGSPPVSTTAGRTAVGSTSSPPMKPYGSPLPATGVGNAENFGNFVTDLLAGKEFTGAASEANMANWLKAPAGGSTTGSAAAGPIAMEGLFPNVTPGSAAHEALFPGMSGAAGAGPAAAETVAPGVGAAAATAAEAAPAAAAGIPPGVHTGAAPTAPGAAAATAPPGFARRVANIPFNAAKNVTTGAANAAKNAYGVVAPRPAFAGPGAFATAVSALGDAPGFGKGLHQLAFHPLNTAGAIAQGVGNELSNPGSTTAQRLEELGKVPSDPLDFAMRAPGVVPVLGDVYSAGLRASENLQNTVREDVFNKGILGMLGALPGHGLNVVKNLGSTLLTGETPGERTFRQGQEREGRAAVNTAGAESAAAFAANPRNYVNGQLQGQVPAYEGVFKPPSQAEFEAAAKQDAADKAAGLTPESITARSGLGLPVTPAGSEQPVAAAAPTPPANGVPRAPARPTVPQVPAGGFGGGSQTGFENQLAALGPRIAQGPSVSLHPDPEIRDAENRNYALQHQSLVNHYGNISQAHGNVLNAQANLIGAQAEQQKNANELGIAKDPRKMAAAITMKTGSPAMGANFAKLMDLYNGAPVTHENLPDAVGPGGPAAHLGELVGRAQRNEIDPAAFIDDVSRIGVTPGSQAEQVVRHVANTAWDEPTWAAAHRGGSWNPFRGFQEDPQVAQRRQASMNRFRQLRELPAAG